MTRDEWLGAHAFLKPVAALAAEVEGALDAIDVAAVAPPRFEEHAEEFAARVPLLKAHAAAVDLEPAGRTARDLIGRLATARLPGQLGESTRRLSEELQRDVGSPRRIVDWLLGDDAFAPASPGLLRYLGWSATARSLAPLVDAFARWRDEERWLHEHCPTCGSAPAMAQLIGTDPGRKRFLCCGCCRTRWQFGRTRCPFCRMDTQRLAVTTIAGESGLRLDTCETCKGYLKTLEGQKNEGLLLEDWTSLHLDLLAHDRGLKRRATSLYDPGPLLAAPGS